MTVKLKGIQSIAPVFDEISEAVSEPITPITLDNPDSHMDSPSTLNPMRYTNSLVLGSINESKSSQRPEATAGDEQVYDSRAELSMTSDAETHALHHFDHGIEALKPDSNSYPTQYSEPYYSIHDNTDHTRPYNYHHQNFSTYQPSFMESSPNQCSFVGTPSPTTYHQSNDHNSFASEMNTQEHLDGEVAADNTPNTPFSYQQHHPFDLVVASSSQFTKQESPAEPYSHKQQNSNTSTLSYCSRSSNFTRRSSNTTNASKQEDEHKPLISTVYWDDESTICYQVEVNGVLVSRRSDTNYVNGTKLLNAAGLSRGKRDGMLKSERQKTIVKVGSMNLKGVWLPYDRAYEIARNQGIIDLLYPLLRRDLVEFFNHEGAHLRRGDDFEVPISTYIN